MNSKQILWSALIALFLVGSVEAGPRRDKIRAHRGQRMSHQQQYQKQNQNVADLVFAYPQLSSFAGAIQEANLLSELKEGENFTLFAPSNQAFQEAGAVNEAQLKNILRYHMLDEQRDSSSLRKMTTSTIEGEPIGITREANGVTINDAKIIYADIAGSNGVIHIIDKVLIPSSMR